MNKAALSRRGFARKLVKRQLDRQVIRLARNSVQDGASVREEYAPVAVLGASVSEATGGSQKSDATQPSPATEITVVFEATANIRASDRLVINAVNILNPEGGPITYEGGETLDVKSVTGLIDEPTYIAATLERKTSRKAR